MFIIIRTFSAWFYEYNHVASQLATILAIQTKISRHEARMYYDGGYSPKMVIHEINKIPVGQDII